MAVKPVPGGFHSVTAYLLVRGATEAIEFYRKAFGATELDRHPGPDGKLLHAEIRIGDSPVMLADEHPDAGFVSPGSVGNTTVGLMLYVDDVDTVFARAIAAGGRQVRPVVDQFYGDRSGTLIDPFGHLWTVATHTEDVPPEEMRRRMDELMESGGPS